MTAVTPAVTFVCVGQRVRGCGRTQARKESAGREGLAEHKMEAEREEDWQETRERDRPRPGERENGKGRDEPDQERDGQTADGEGRPTTKTGEKTQLVPDRHEV